MTPPTDSTPKGRVRHHREVLAAAKDASGEERRELLDAAVREVRHRRQSRPLPRLLARRAGRRALALLAVVPFACGMVSAYLALVLVLGIVGLVAAADGRLLDITNWKPLLFATLGTAVLLPSAAAAWQWRDLDDDD